MSFVEYCAIVYPLNCFLFLVLTVMASQEPDAMAHSRTGTTGFIVSFWLLLSPITVVLTVMTIVVIGVDYLGKAVYKVFRD